MLQLQQCECVDVNGRIIQIYQQYVKGNLTEFQTIYSIHAAAGTWHACSRRIRTISWARLNTTLFLAAHRLFFLQLLSQLIRGGQNQIAPPPCTGPTSITSHRQLRTSPTTVVPKCGKPFSCSLCFQQSSRCCSCSGQINTADGN